MNVLPHWVNAEWNRDFLPQRGRGWQMAQVLMFSRGKTMLLRPVWTVQDLWERNGTMPRTEVFCCCAMSLSPCLLFSMSTLLFSFPHLHLAAAPWWRPICLFPHRSSQQHHSETIQWASWSWVHVFSLQWTLTYGTDIQISLDEEGLLWVCGYSPVPYQHNSEVYSRSNIKGSWRQCSKSAES